MCQQLAARCWHHAPLQCCVLGPTPLTGIAATPARMFGSSGLTHLSQMSVISAMLPVRSQGANTWDCPQDSGSASAGTGRCCDSGQHVACRRAQSSKLSSPKAVAGPAHHQQVYTANVCQLLHGLLVLRPSQRQSLPALQPPSDTLEPVQQRDRTNLVQLDAEAQHGPLHVGGHVCGCHVLGFRQGRL